jgi:hypothetical protein
LLLLLLIIIIIIIILLILILILILLLFIKSEFLQKQKSCRVRRFILQLGSTGIALNFMYSGKNSDFIDNNINIIIIIIFIIIIIIIVLLLLAPIEFF